MSASGQEDEEDRAPETPEKTETVQTAQNVQIANPIKAAEDPASMVRSDEAKAILAPLDAVTDADILLDVSENSTMHIAGSVVIPYMEFDVQAGVLKPVPEISKILGDAGISREDSVVIYGECLPCGGGPSVATYVYWMMKSLGHEKVKVLRWDGRRLGGNGTGHHERRQDTPGKIYTPAETANYTATYEFVKSGQAQIVDARTLQEFGSGSIPGSISIPYDQRAEREKDQRRGPVG